MFEDERSPCPLTIPRIIRALHLGRIPPELITMHLCFMGSAVLGNNAHELFEKHKKDLKKLTRAYLEEHGQWPHPLVGLKLLKL